MESGVDRHVDQGPRLPVTAARRMRWLMVRAVIEGSGRALVACGREGGRGTRSRAKEMDGTGRGRQETVFVCQPSAWRDEYGNCVHGRVRIKMLVIAPECGLVAAADRKAEKVSPATRAIRDAGQANGGHRFPKTICNGKCSAIFLAIFRQAGSGLLSGISTQ